MINIGEASTNNNCSAVNGTGECRQIFDRLALDENAKLIYIHLKGIDINGTDKEINPLRELVWVKNTSLHYLSYPDDFEALSFRLLSDDIYDINIDIDNTSLSEYILYDRNDTANTSYFTTRDVLNFTYTDIITNSTNGFICHRFFHDQNLRNLSVSIIGIEFYLAYVIWFGYDYKCFSAINPFKTESRVSKYSPMMVLLATLCILSMFWSPILLTLIERENTRRLPNDVNVASNRETTVHISKDECFVYYNEGDIPYGFSRLLLVLFQTKYRFGTQWKILPYIPHLRFFILATFTFSTVYYLVDGYIHDYLARDIQGYETLYRPEITFENFFVFLCYMLVLCAGFSVRKNYSYVFDFALAWFSKDASILRKVPFTKLYQSKDAIMSNTIVNRFTSIFRLGFWKMVILLSFRGTQRLLKKEHRRGPGIWFAVFYAFFLLFNILFLLFVSLLPFMWYMFCMSRYFFNSFFKLLFNILFPKCQNVFARCPKLSTFIKIIIKLVLYFYTAFFVIALIELLYKNMMLQTIAICVRIIIYVFFIVIPQLSALHYRLIFLFLVVVSYIFQHLKTFYALYQELLKKMFSYTNNEHNIEIKQFDYVVANTFPIHIEVFYLLLKFVLTCAFFYISLSNFLLLDDKDTRDDWELINISSFVFILISPAVVGYLFIKPVDKRVASYSKQIEELMQIWKDNIQCLHEQTDNKHVLCDAWSRQSMLPFSYMFCCCVLFCCGCFADIDSGWHCYLCSYYKTRDLKACDIEDQNIDRGEEVELNRVFIKLPDNVEHILRYPTFKRLFTLFFKKENRENSINLGNML